MPHAPQLTAIEAGREALRARFAGGAFPAALGQAIADEMADVAMAPVLARLDEAQRAYIFDTAELKRENDRLRAELAEVTKTPRDRANDRVRQLLAQGDDEGACFVAEAAEADAARNV